jgi:hypothetical protein
VCLVSCATCCCHLFETLGLMWPGGCAQPPRHIKQLQAACLQSYQENSSQVCFQCSKVLLCPTPATCSESAQHQPSAMQCCGSAQRHAVGLYCGMCVRVLGHLFRN